MNHPAVKLPQMFHVEHVASENVRDVWAYIYQDVARACDDTLTPEEVLDALSSKRATLWLIFEGEHIIASLVTQARIRNGNTRLEVLTVGGSKFNEWAPIMQDILQDMDYPKMRAYCRRGMAKWLKQLGWREVQVVMEYENGR